ncbi:MAG: ribonuclease P protein component [Vulcanimicrobiaceae bacterium]
MRWFGRLQRSNEIAFVRRRGRSIGLATLRAYAVESPSGSLRVAVTVSKAVGIAVVRNLVRRRIRGALDGFAPGTIAGRILFVAKPEAATASFDDLARDVGEALSRLAAAASR